MNEISIEVKNFLTPTSCSKLLIEIIKYILYSSEQIPLNYEHWSCFMKSVKMKLDPIGEDISDEITPAYTHKEWLLRHYYRKISFIFNNFEDIFKNLELEFIENGGAKEFVIMIGFTILRPKKVFRISIPLLTHCNCIMKHSAYQNLRDVCEKMFGSDELHKYLNDHIQPMNIYFLIKPATDIFPVTEWFIPYENFTIPKVKQIFIKLRQPENYHCTCSTYLYDFFSLQDMGVRYSLEEYKIIDESNSHLTWYQPKENLKGFKDYKVNGISAFNLIKA